MPFKQQRQAVGYVPRQQVGLLLIKLKKAGYEQHTGPAIARDGEIAAFRRTFRSPTLGLRQNHVQIVERDTTVAVYAHTEPHTDRFSDHAVSAVFDQASFAGGSRMLQNDLAAVGFELATYSDACASARGVRRTA